MNSFLESRKAQRDTALSGHVAGKGRIVQTLNLTAKVQLNQLVRAENRAATPEELELCYDFVLVPVSPKGGAR